MSTERIWDPRLYDSKHHFVTRYAEELIPLLNPQPGERILDLGTGTGHLSAQIADYGAHVVGLDRSSEMVAQARAAYPQIEFVEGDAANFAFDQPFNGVFSNAALHWVLTPEKVIDCIWRALVPGGRFVAEFGGKGNAVTLIGSVYDALVAMGYPLPESSPYYLPSAAEYATLLEQRGFRVSYMRHFDRVTPLEGSDGIANFLQMYFPQTMAMIAPDRRAEFVARVEAGMRPTLYRDGVWHIDFVRLRLLATKPA